MNYSPEFVRALIDRNGHLLDVAYHRMLTATDIGEAEHYEAVYAERANKLSVLFAELEGN